jgi:TM2 domain-containing membrane protein YozV
MTDTFPAAKPDLALYEAGRKSMPVAYVLWFFLGLFGAHRFYTRAGKTGWLLLALHVGGWLLVGIGYYTGAHTETQTVETVFGQSTNTSISFDGSGGPLAGIGGILRSLAWLWWLVDIVLVPGLVRGWNNRLAAGLGMAIR